MTDAPYESLFRDVVAKAGGLAAMSAVDVEVAATIVRLLVAMRSAPAVEVPRIADTLARFQQSLPQPSPAAPLQGWVSVTVSFISKDEPTVEEEVAEITRLAGQHIDPDSPGAGEPWVIYKPDLSLAEPDGGGSASPAVREADRAPPVTTPGQTNKHGEVVLYPRGKPDCLLREHCRPLYAPTADPPWRGGSDPFAVRSDF